MASRLTLNNPAISKDALLFKMALSCFESGWKVVTHPSASTVEIQNAPITAFFPLLYPLWTVKIGGMPPTVFIPDQESFDPFVPPEGYEKHLVGSYEPLNAFNDAMGMALPIAMKWTNIVLGELQPTSVRRFLVGWVNPGNSYSSSFYELENLPQSIYASEFTMGAALQCNFGIPTSGGYSCECKPLKVDPEDSDENHYSLYLGLGDFNVDAAFAALWYYASHSNAASIHAWFERPLDASNPNTFGTNIPFDLYVSPHALFYGKALGAPGPVTVDLYSACVFPIGNSTSAAFVGVSNSTSGFRKRLTFDSGIWALKNGVIFSDFGILISYMFTNLSTPSSCSWEANEGAIQNLEAQVLICFGRIDINNYELFGIMKDIIVGNSPYPVEAIFEHDTDRYYTYTVGHPQAGLLVKVED